LKPATFSRIPKKTEPGQDYGKIGFRAFDSDMHVFEPADLYQKYMDSKWGDRIPVGQPRTKHGMMRYFQKSLRPNSMKGRSRSDTKRTCGLSNVSPS
jgi:hypothetical protein